MSLRIKTKSPGRGSVLGKSGSGKTVEAQKIMSEIVNQGGTVVALDIHHVLAPDEIFWKYRKTFEACVKDIDTYNDGIKCNIFEPVVYSDGIREHSVDAVGAVIDAVDRTLKLGYSQKASLRTAICRVMEDGAYEQEGFAALNRVLGMLDSPASEAVREKLYPLIEHNIFRAGDLFIQEGKINLVRLSRFDLGTQETVAEMLLAYIWRLAMTNAFKEKGLFIFVDECQNLPSGKRSALAQMLIEGRKLNLNLILGTQQIPRESNSVVGKYMTQCGLILYFRPETNRMKATARMISLDSEREWGQVLSGLKRGEFVATGSLELGKCTISKPLKVGAYEEAEQKGNWSLPTMERGKVIIPMQMGKET